MVAPLAAAAAATPVLISAPVPESAARVSFTVVVIVPSGGSTDRLGAGLSPGLRKGPAPIDRSVEDFQILSTPTYIGTAYDCHHTTAFQEIVQHRMANDDWPDDWIFEDSRFGLADSDDKLLAFLTEMR
jgi:hypothetical protein